MGIHTDISVLLDYSKFYSCFIRNSDVISNISIFYLFFIFILNTAIFDSFAFFVGSNLGKNCIAPKISPNKTIEGLIGGFIGVIIFSFHNMPLLWIKFLAYRYMYLWWFSCIFWRSSNKFS